MDILPLNFRALQLCGLWYEDESKFFLPKMIYRSVCVLLMFEITLSQLIGLVAMKGDVDEFTEVLFLTLTYVTFCIKIINFIGRRDEMRILIDNFRSTLCRAKTPEEKEIMQRYSDMAARIIFVYMTIAQLSGLSINLRPILSADGELSLPFACYQPLDVSKRSYFVIAYLQQVFVLHYGILGNVALDSMVYGFIIMATAQFELNCHRLRESRETKRSIEHHVFLQRIVGNIQNYFIVVIVSLFSTSLITLCTSIFKLSEKKLPSFEFLSLSLYLCCILTEVFLYCWYGNELELKSKAVMDAIYSSEWPIMPREERRNLWFAMLSSRDGSVISCHGQCSLTLNTFLWIVKTSYAAFNLLQQAR